MRVVKQFTLEDTALFKSQILHWSQQFEEVVWLDSNTGASFGNPAYSRYDGILAVDALTAIKTDYHQAFEKLEEYRKITGDWIFGYLTYDLKNDVENLSSENHDQLQFPDLYFFQPKKLFLLKGNVLEMRYLNFVADEMEEDLETIKNYEQKEIQPIVLPKNSITARTPKEPYLEKVQQMLAYIQQGDIYEANFCQEFYAENALIQPLEVFEKLNAISRAPFAAFVKLESKYLLCASPERYLQKDGTKVISQPIKGTMQRSQDPEEDKRLAQTLFNDPKERSENIMITDLVRNDLSRTATRGSVQVDELCGLYSFMQVHQLISTISATVLPETSPLQLLKTTFPMGSMTGAPKCSAMKIIEELEDAKRGVYSGAVGYFTPKADFDFNVVIRSILYNAAQKYVSFSVGSAITSLSVPEKEYEECLLKAKAMREVLL